MEESTWISVFSRMYRERIILLSNYINDDFANQMIATLLYMESEDARSPVAMYFNVRSQTIPGFSLRTQSQRSVPHCLSGRWG